MVKAELTYNPYNRTTEIVFNGQPPRINSLVEKYRSRILHDWVASLPEIFCNEMNGFDFELCFSGTDLDFEDVKQAFDKAGVSDEQVKFLYVKKLEEHREKMRRIKELLSWICENQNHNFNRELFLESNQDWIDADFPMISIHGDCHIPDDYEWMQLDVEKIDDIAEMKGTDLTHTPILFYLEKKNWKNAQNEIRTIIKRPDIGARQIFFIPVNGMSIGESNRFLKDLGMAFPNVVSTADDESIYRYLREYPISDYVNNFVKLMHETINEIQQVLIRTAQDEEQNHSERHDQIEALNEDIEKLTKSYETFSARATTITPSSFSYAKERLMTKVFGWKRKRTKIIGSAEAERVAIEYEREIQREFVTFEYSLNRTIEIIQNRIKNELQECYKNTMGENEAFISENSDMSPEVFEPAFTFGMEKELMEIVSQSKGANGIPVYYYQDWRNFATSLVEKHADRLIQQRVTEIEAFENDLCNAYKSHLMDLLAEKQATRLRTSQELNQEEKTYLNDNQWFDELKEQVRQIERR